MNTEKGDMDFALDITLLVLNSANTVLHSVGFYLLSTLHKNDKNNIQRLFLLNLSITEAFNNILILIINIFSGILEVQIFMDATARDCWFDGW